MTTYRANIENYYQIPDDAAPAGKIIVDNDLIDFSTGQPLVDGGSQEQLTGETTETLVLASAGQCTPVTVTNDADRAALVDIINKQQSEVDTSLLGIPRSETALGLFSGVNIYGVDTREWLAGPDVAGYIYYRDPPEWTFDGDYGYYWRHLPAESAIQAYSFPPPKSFTYTVDDGTGRFPGGYTNGSMTAYWETKRTFRYQPGRVTGFTMGVRMSTDTGVEGDIIQWGCRNSYGDGYYFQLEKGTDLYIVRTSPDLGVLKIARQDWNGDKVQANEGATGWSLDLSKVTMFKIEFSWYGAVGAQFYAYVPVDNGEARWVKLHRIFAENQFTVPSLRSAYMRMFTLAASVAGAVKPTFINLYGSSVYIDGGDKGTITIGSASLREPKAIDGTSRSLIGLNVKNKINNIDNQKNVYPVSLDAYSSVDARFDLIFRPTSGVRDVQYGYGNGTSIFRGNSDIIPVIRTGSNQLTIVSGTFPDITNEVTGSTAYLTGRRVKVEGAGILATHVTSINRTRTVITTDRFIPNGTTSIRLSRMNAYALGNAVIASGVTTGRIMRKDNGGYWRIGLIPSFSGSYTVGDPVVWLASSYPFLRYNRFGQLIGEGRATTDWGFPNELSPFFVIINSGSTSYTISGATSGITVTGSTNPWPIGVVAELMDGASIGDITIIETANVETPGSGATKALTSFTLSGASETSIIAGGSNYVAHKFESSPADPLSGAVVDVQGYKTMPESSRVATYFISAGETKRFDLTNLFGPDKMYIAGPPSGLSNSGGLFVMATARAGSGEANVTLNWEEQ